MKVDPAAAELKGDAAMAMYRVVQEGLTNVARHAHASLVSIEVGARPALKVKLADDGRGFDPQRVTEGFGLLGMRERIVGLGGTLSIESGAGRGTLIQVELPWPN
jgi:signal transduction histidine kinase